MINAWGQDPGLSKQISDLDQSVKNSVYVWKWGRMDNQEAHTRKMVELQWLITLGTTEPRMNICQLALS